MALLQKNQPDLLRSRDLFNESAHHAGLTKQLVLEALAVLSAFFFGFVMHRYFGDGASMTLFLAAASLYALLAFFSSLLDGTRIQRIITIFLQAAALVFWLPVAKLSLTVVFFIIIAGILFLSEMILKRELRYTTQIRFFTISRPFISNIVTLVVLMMLAFYLPGIISGKPLVSSEKLDRFGAYMESVVRIMYPDLPETPTAGAVAERVIKRQFAEDEAFQKMDPPAQQVAVEAARNQILNEFSADAGVRIRPEDRFGPLAQTLLQNAAEQWRKQYGPRFIVFWTVLTFVIVRSFGFVLSFVIAAIAYALYLLLLAAKVIILQGENAMRETVTFS